MSKGRNVVGRSMGYAKFKKMSHPNGLLHGDSQTYIEIVKCRFFEFWGRLGTAHRSYLKVVKTAISSTYRNRNSVKNMEFSYMALKWAFLDRFWWNFYLCPLIRGRRVQIRHKNYSLFNFRYRAITLNIAILPHYHNFHYNCAVPKRDWTVILFWNLDSPTSN